MKRLIAMVLAGALAGCATTSPAPIQVAIPMDCENSAKPVPLPKIALDDDDVRVIGAYRAGMVTANHVIVNARDCFRGVRLKFAAKP